MAPVIELSSSHVNQMTVYDFILFSGTPASSNYTRYSDTLFCEFLFYARECLNLNQSYLITDCDIVGKVNGVCFTYSKEGRPSGEAFIELKMAEDFKNALAKDRKYMGHRYIEGKQAK